MADIAREKSRILRGSREGWASLRSALLDSDGNQFVAAKWSVDYDKLGHDILINARVKLIEPDDVLLQVWLMDQHPGIWIPEYRPWVSSVVEFEPEEGARQAHVGLFDSKWRKEDAGQVYGAFLWGYFRHKGSEMGFGFEQQFTYPG